MDERLRSALDVANLMTTFNLQKELIKQKYLSELTYYIDGYSFKIDRELVNFLNTLVQVGADSDIVILDSFENPYMIDDVKSFRDQILEIYFENTNRYYYDYIKLKKDRSITKMVDIDE